MPQAGLEPTTSWLPEWSLSAFCHIAFQERKLGFIKMFNDKPLLISVGRSLHYTVVGTVLVGDHLKYFNLSELISTFCESPRSFIAWFYSSQMLIPFCV